MIGPSVVRSTMNMADWEHTEEPEDNHDSKHREELSPRRYGNSLDLSRSPGIDRQHHRFQVTNHYPLSHEARCKIDFTSENTASFAAQDGAMMNAHTMREPDFSTSDQRGKSSPFAASWKGIGGANSPDQRSASKINRSIAPSHFTDHEAFPYQHNEEYIDRVANFTREEALTKQQDLEEEGDRKPAAKSDVEMNIHYSRENDTSRLDTGLLPSPKQQETSDEYIAPSFSFGYDDDLRCHGDGYLLHGWSAANDPAFHNMQTGGTPSYAEPVVTYTLGDRAEKPAEVQRPQSRDSVVVGEITKREASATFQKKGDARQGKSKRQPMEQELAAATTPRAQSAVYTWYQRFNDLVDYKERYGDCNVPQKYPENAQLGIWVNKQRMEKKFMEDGKRSSMTRIKIEALTSIGFQWAKRKGEASWIKKYNELKEYFSEMQHCNVPTKYAPNPALGRWVSTQRSEYKKYMKKRSKHLTRQKVIKLNELGFKWEMLQVRSSSSSEGSEY